MVYTVNWAVETNRSLIDPLCKKWYVVMGSSDSSVVERQTRDWSQVRGAAREKHSPGSAFCADYAAVSIPPHVTTVACKKPSSSAKSVVDRLQLNSRASYVCGFEKQSCKLVHDCMVCTELALRQQQLQVAPAV